MNPMTHADALKALFLTGADLDLTDRHAAQYALSLAGAIERAAQRNLDSLVDGNDALRAVADEPMFSDEPFAADIARTIAARKAHEFKVGDRVRVTLEDRPWFSRGDIGIVEADGIVNFNGQGNAEVIGDGRWFLGPYGMEHADAIPVATPAEDAALDEIEARQVDLSKPEVFDILGFTQSYFNQKGA